MVLPHEKSNSHGQWGFSSRSASRLAGDAAVEFINIVALDVAEAGAG